jgi:butyrate kinase
MKNLILNPGSTSTKIAVFDAQILIFSKSIKHSQEDLEGFTGIMEQKQYRSKAVMKTCEEQGLKLSEIAAVIGIGGLLRPGVGGVYEVNNAMIRDLTDGTYGEHAANLGGVLAAELASNLKIKAYIADPITTDELQEVARISGIPEIVRTGRVHTLNHKAAASRAAKELGITREDCRLVVAHLGGGISIAAHLGSRIIDTSDPRGEGPFCMDRSGALHALDLAELCFSGKYTKTELLKRINGSGGTVAYLNTRDFFDVMRMRAEKDPMAISVYNAMTYQIAKEIGAQTAVLRGKVDAIVFTGGMAREKEFIDDISGYVGGFAKIIVYPGEFELEALAEYVTQVQNREIIPIVYEDRAD